jgi:phosphoenolpyruvate carboxykinase (ATP)
VDPIILNPRDTWADKTEYDTTAARLVKLFNDNFARFADHVDQSVRDAAPRTVAGSAQPIAQERVITTA